MKRLLYITALVLTACAANAQQDFTEALVSITPTNISGTTASFGTAAWSFEPKSAIEVTSLGCLDSLIAASGTINVGLWDNNGQLLASSSITGTSGLVNVTRYEDIDAVFLSTQTYFVGASSAAGGSLFVTLVGGEAGGTFTTAPSISLDKLCQNSGNLAWPSSAVEGGDGVLPVGPTFGFLPVPEPSTWALLGVGSLVLAAWRGRRAGA